jgi:hypothetical protein
MTASSIEILSLKPSDALSVLGPDDKQQYIDCLVKIKLSDDNHKWMNYQKTFFKARIESFGRIDVKVNNYCQYFFMKAKLVLDITYDKNYFSTIF